MSTSADIAQYADPFTLIYARLWAVFLGNPKLVALIKRRVDYGDPSFQQEPPEGTAGDRPELRISQGDFTIRPYGSNSKTTDFIQSYIPQVTTDALGIVSLNAVKWEITRAFAMVDPYLGLPGLVRRYTVEQAVDVENAPKGWMAVMAIHVEGYVSFREFRDGA